MGLDDNKHLSSLVYTSLWYIITIHVYKCVIYFHCITCHMRSHLCMDVNCYPYIMWAAHVYSPGQDSVKRADC